MFVIMDIRKLISFYFQKEGEACTHVTANSYKISMSFRALAKKNNVTVIKTFILICQTQDKLSALLTQSKRIRDTYNEVVVLQP